MLQTFLEDALTQFWRPDEPWLIVAGLGLWLLLRSLLPPGNKYVLKQTLAFFVLCILGQFGAALMHAMGWSMVAGTLSELSLIGVGIALVRFGGMLLFRTLLPRLRIETPRILEDITVIVGYGLLGLVRLRAAGMDVSQLFATSAVITAIVAFAMQDTLGNILGGLAIHLDHSVEIGDWILIDGVSGRVIDIRWRYTKVATRNGEKVVIPNSQLMKNKFVVVGIDRLTNDTWRRWIWFNVGLNQSPSRVIEIAESGVRDAHIANVARQPEATCVLMDFGPGYLRLCLRYWLTNPMLDDPTDSAVRVHLLAALERAGIPLAIPEESRHIIKDNESHALMLTTREMARRIEVLTQVDLFAGLTQEELRLLASHLAHAPFVSGDIMTRQGALGDWLYILIGGEAEVWLEHDDGNRKLLTLLPAGSVFGEMGLMTGEPRRATVIAKTDADCYRLDKTGLEVIMRGRPAIAEEISRILAARDAKLTQLRRDFDAAASARKTPHHETILGRIRDFFKLPE